MDTGGDQIKMIAGRMDHAFWTPSCAERMFRETVSAYCVSVMRDHTNREVRTRGVAEATSTLVLDLIEKRLEK